MTAQKIEESDTVVDQGGALNEVRLQGKVMGAPELRDLADGESVLNVRLVVARSGQAAARQRSDSIDCAVWARGKLRQKVAGLRTGDLVEVSGALQRRFFRTGGATASRVEVELTSARIIRRAKT